jgi:hypothetical protein
MITSVQKSQCPFSTNQCEKSPLYEPLADFSSNNHCAPYTVSSSNGQFIIIKKFISESDNVYLSGNTQIVINEDGYYEIDAEVKIKTKSSCCDNNSNIKLKLYDITNNIILATSTFDNNVASLVYTSPQLTSEIKIGFIITDLGHHSKIKCLKMTGTIKNSPRLTLLDEVLAFDAARKYRYVPVNPNLPNPPYGPQYPNPSPFPQAAVNFGWKYNIIPHEINQLPQPNNYISTPSSPVPTNPALPASIDADAYHKINSVSAYLPYCIGFEDPINLDKNDPRVTVFTSDLEQRGVNNYRKKVYVSALTMDLMPNYAEKFDVFFNEVYTTITNYHKPVLSVFKEALVKFFLAMHIGYDDYPDYVIEYFTKFTDAVGLGIPTNPEFKKSVIFCNLTIKCVSEYFFKRYNIIRQTNDKTTLLYYWNLAGLPKESIISEALHNIIAFNQFLNVFYLMIRDQYGPGTVVPTGLPNPAFQVIKYNFIQKFCAIDTDINIPTDAQKNEAKLNNTREFFRLTVPNSASFSRIEQVPVDNNVVIQGRHVHQAIMFSNDPTYIKYKPEIYNDFTFDLNSAMSSECPTTECPKCPYLIPINPLKNINPEVKLVQSIIDNETVIESPCIKDNVVISDPGKVIPVYANQPDPDNLVFPDPITQVGPKYGPIYGPFGFGYRRCAGEGYTMFGTMKLFERFRSIPFKFEVGPPPSIAVAPFTLVPDNIYFDPAGVPVCI